MKRLSILVVVAAFVGSFTVPVHGQSALIQAALQNFVRIAHTWTATQTFTNLTLTGTVQLPDGTAGAPGLTFASATNKGLFAATNLLGVATGGNGRWAFDSSGSNHQFTLAGTVLAFSSSAGLFGDSADLFVFRDAANVLALKNGTNAQKLRLYQTTTGPVANTLDGTLPTISSGFGSSPSVVAGSTALSMRINVGTGGAATAGVIGVPTATTGWNCTVQDMTTNIATRQTASTTATITFTAASAWTASDILVATCIAY